MYTAKRYTPLHTRHQGRGRGQFDCWSNDEVVGLLACIITFLHGKELGSGCIADYPFFVKEIESFC